MVVVAQDVRCTVEEEKGTDKRASSSCGDSCIGFLCEDGRSSLTCEGESLDSEAEDDR